MSSPPTWCGVVVGQALHTPATPTSLRLRPTRAHEPFGLSFGEQPVQQVVLHRRQCRAGSRGRTDLLVHVQYVVVDGALGKAQGLADLAIGQATRQEPKNLNLTCCQASRP